VVYTWQPDLIMGLRVHSCAQLQLEVVLPAAGDCRLLLTSCAGA
jgi:hypothetical protein